MAITGIRNQQAEHIWTETEADVQKNEKRGRRHADAAGRGKLDGQRLGDGLDVAEPESDDGPRQQQGEPVVRRAEEHHARRKNDDGRIHDEIGSLEVEQAAGEGTGQQNGHGENHEKHAGGLDRPDFLGVEAEKRNDARITKAAD